MTRESTNTPEQTPASSASKIAGIAIITGSLLSLFLIMHHPSSSTDTSGIDLENLSRHSGGIDPVHWTFTAVIGILIYGFMGLSDQMGSKKPLVRAGLIAYLLGSFAMLNAIMATNMASNQNFAALGIIAVSAAMLLWSAALLHRQGSARLVGGAGVLASLGPILLIAGHGVLFMGAGATIVATTHQMPVDLHTMILVIVVQTVWNLFVASLLLRGRI